MPRNPETRIFLIHLAAYVVVNAILIAINLMQAPAEGAERKLWFVWPLLGWGIGVAAHGLALLMQERAAPGSWMDDERKRGFAIHAFVYVAVNALLVGVDLMTSPGLQWVWWPILGWGAGLAAHGFLVWRAERRGGAGSGGAPDPASASPRPATSPTERPGTGSVQGRGGNGAPAASARPAKRVPRRTPPKPA